MRRPVDDGVGDGREEHEEPRDEEARARRRRQLLVRARDERLDRGEHLGDLGHEEVALAA